MAIADLARLARPYQYVKNLFVFVPAFFGFRFFDPQVMGRSAVCFVAFCLAASAVYVLNDWMDREEDARHPTKKDRPIASGRVGAGAALAFGLALMAAGLGVAAALDLGLLAPLGVYLALNLSYSLGLKRIAIVDVVVIALGFNLRLEAGSLVSGVDLSHWIVVMTFLLALFLGFAKRRDDLVLEANGGEKLRSVSSAYSLAFLDAVLVMSASIVILCYILWTISPQVIARLGTESLYLTSVFVLLGVLRYMQIAMVLENSGNPSKALLRDRFLHLVLLGWVGAFLFILYIS